MASRLVEAASLGDDLTDGLAALEKARIDVDRINLKTARTRK